MGGGAFRAYVSPFQVFGGTAPSSQSSTPIPFDGTSNTIPNPFEGAGVDDAPNPFEGPSSASVPNPFEGSSSSQSSIPNPFEGFSSFSSSGSGSSSLSSSTPPPNTSSSSSTSGTTGGSSGGTSGGSSGGNSGGNSGGAGGGGGTSGGNSNFTPPNQQGGPDYIRTFYKPVEPAPSDVIYGDDSGYKSDTELIDGVHSGAELNKPVPTKAPSTGTTATATKLVKRVPKTTSTGPAEWAAGVALLIAVAATLALSARRASMLSSSIIP